jgi:hypothetical protein
VHDIYRAHCDVKNFDIVDAINALVKCWQTKNDAYNPLQVIKGETIQTSQDGNQALGIKVKKKFCAPQIDEDFTWDLPEIESFSLKTYINEPVCDLTPGNYSSCICPGYLNNIYGYDGLVISGS